MRYSLILDNASKKFHKAKDAKAVKSLQIAIEHTKEIANYVYDMVLVREIKGIKVPMYYTTRSPVYKKRFIRNGKWY